MNIEVKNFRVFRENTKFSLRPVTLLTGPNNSGKSSFTKLLLLLMKDSIHLQFNSGEHNLHSYEKSLNWNSVSPNLLIQIGPVKSVLPNTNVQYKYQNGELETFTLISNDIPWCSVQSMGAENEGDIGKLKVLVSFDFEYFVQRILEKEFYCKSNNRDSPTLLRHWENENKIDPTLSIQKLKNMTEGANVSDVQIIHARNIALCNAINNLNMSSNLYDLIVGGENRTYEFIDEIYSVQKNFTASFETEIWGAIDLRDFYDGHFLHNLSIDFSVKLQDALRTYFGSKLDDSEIDIKPSKLFEILFGNLFTLNSGNISGEYSTKENFLRNLMGRLLTEDPLRGIESIQYISTDRINPHRVIPDYSLTKSNSVIKTFNNEEKKLNAEYITKVLDLFEIDGQIVVDRIENSASVIYIQKGKSKVALADLGFGLSQLIPILLKVFTLVPKIEGNLSLFASAEDYFHILADLKNELLIVEEPEANLHPNFQSKLADFLVLTQKYYPVIFIIETHSEYLIRKLQYLTAKGEISPDDSVIYYFNPDDRVTDKEPKVKEITINEAGILSKRFGPGFFDEATNLQFELTKLNRSQNN